MITRVVGKRWRAPTTWLCHLRPRSERISQINSLWSAKRSGLGTLIEALSR